MTDGCFLSLFSLLEPRHSTSFFSHIHTHIHTQDDICIAHRYFLFRLFLSCAVLFNFVHTFQIQKSFSSIYKKKINKKTLVYNNHYAPPPRSLHVNSIPLHKGKQNKKKSEQDPTYTHRAPLPTWDHCYYKCCHRTALHTVTTHRA